MTDPTLEQTARSYPSALTEPERIRARIGRLSAWLHIACLFVTGVLVIGGLAVLVLPGVFEALVEKSGLPGADGGMGFEERLILVPLMVLNLAFYVGAAFAAARLFGGWRTSEVFTVEATDAVRMIGLCLLGIAVMALISSPIMSVVLTWDAERGSRAVALQLNAALLLSALSGALLAVIAQVMRAGLALAEENAGFV
ncbi:MAG: DUF2975 domain-containing protein [Pseudomonadota bacterium]